MQIAVTNADGLGGAGAVSLSDSLGTVFGRSPLQFHFFVIGLVRPTWYEMSGPIMLYLNGVPQ